jgi:hypothetical protein
MITAQKIISTISESKVPPSDIEVIKNIIQKWSVDFLGNNDLKCSRCSPEQIDYYLKSRDLVSMEEINRFFDIVSEKIGKYGWFISGENREQAILSLQPNYDETVTEIPRYLYHSTEPGNVPIILRRGLIPTGVSGGNSWRYPPRVYFLIDDIIYHSSSYTTLRIDTNLLGRNVKFYKDTTLIRIKAVWTYSHIPPNAISVWRSGG